MSALEHARVAINDEEPVQLTPSGVEEGTSVTIQVQNIGSEAVYLGGEGLTSTSYGVSVVPGGAVTLDDLPPKFELYALSALGNSYVAVLMVRR